MLMADFYYHVMKKHYGERCKLIYTDTDSLVCHLQGVKDPLEDFKSPALKDFFEQPETVKVPGLMKVECLCYFFGAYSPKNYIYVTKDFKVNFKKKGVPKHAIHPITFKGIAEIEKIFVTNMEKEEKFECIQLRSDDHEVKLKVESKVLCNKDTKRCLNQDKQHSNAKVLVP
jgi:DNA polymerase elongation subunit (family B)